MQTLPEIQTGNDEALYNIGAVARLTGVSMPTLRAWERRYNFPDSARTEGGHRLYSESDVMRLRWVKARIDEGLQTSQAIQALHHQEQAGRLARNEPRLSQVEEISTQPHLASTQARLLESLLQHNTEAADSILGEALPLSTPEDLILDVISPTFTAIGEAWHAGQINIATEHLATHYLRQRLLMWMMSGPPPRLVRPVVLACAPNEWHEGSLLALGAILRRSRWPVTYLGQSLPLSELANLARELQPKLIVFVAMSETSAAELAEWPHWLPDASRTGSPVIGFGGLIFNLQPEWRMRVPGVYLGNTLREGVRAIEGILGD
jgi:DNA-binding transcriptional MerR regulator